MKETCRLKWKAKSMSYRDNNGIIFLHKSIDLIISYWHQKKYVTACIIVSIMLAYLHNIIIFKLILKSYS